MTKLVSLIYINSFSFELLFFLLILFLLLQRTGFNIITHLNFLDNQNLVSQTIKVIFLFIEVYFLIFMLQFIINYICYFNFNFNFLLNLVYNPLYYSLIKLNFFITKLFLFYNFIFNLIILFFYQNLINLEVMFLSIFLYLYQILINIGPELFKLFKILYNSVISLETLFYNLINSFHQNIIKLLHILVNYLYLILLTLEEWFHNLFSCLYYIFNSYKTPSLWALIVNSLINPTLLFLLNLNYIFINSLLFNIYLILLYLLLIIELLFLSIDVILEIVSIFINLYFYILDFGVSILQKFINLLICIISIIQLVFEIVFYHIPLFFYNQIYPITILNYLKIATYFTNLFENIIVNLKLYPALIKNFFNLIRFDIILYLKNYYIYFNSFKLNINFNQYSLFSSNTFTFYNKYLLLIFLIIYYLGVYIYYKLPIWQNQVKNQQLYLFKYEYPLLVGLLFLSYIFVISSNNLFIIYLGFEIQTFIILILTGQLRQIYTVISASLKYFFFSVISSVFFLLGIIYIYNFSGTLNYYELNYFLIYNWSINLNSFFTTTGLILILLSFFFKLGLFPFYIWVLNIFEGFPKLIIILLLTLNKFNLYIFLIKFLYIITSFNIIILNWCLHFLSIVGIISLFIGSWLTITQTNINRFFAATSITHMSFLMLGLKTNLYLILYEKLNSLLIIYSYFIIYIIQTLLFFFILVWWTSLLNSSKLYNINFVKLKINYININNLKDFIWFHLFSKKILFCLVLLLFNFSGFPPFSFFYIKFNLILLLFYNYSYLDGLISLYLSIIITGGYIRWISIMYLENNFDNLKEKKIFKYLYQLNYSNNFFKNIITNKTLYLKLEYLILLFTFTIAFYNYLIYLF